MGDGFYDYLLGKKVEDTAAAPNNEPTVAQDEAIGKPWTHRYTIYCADPESDFLENLKKNGCVVAVYEKVKETTEPSSDKEATPTNE